MILMPGISGYQYNFTTNCTAGKKFLCFSRLLKRKFTGDLRVDLSFLEKLKECSQILAEPLRVLPGRGLDIINRESGFLAEHILLRDYSMSNNFYFCFFMINWK